MIQSCSATVVGDDVHIDFEVLDWDLPFNGSVAGWQTLSLEFDYTEAMGEGDVGDGFWNAVYTGTQTLVNPDDVSAGSVIILPLTMFASGDIDAWFNVAGSLDTFAFSFYNHLPEPGTLTLLALGGLGLWRRRRRR